MAWIVVMLPVVGLYIGLVTTRNTCKNAFARIDVQLTRRYDLIPNLVEIARACMKHKRENLTVIAAHNPSRSQ